MALQTCLHISRSLQSTESIFHRSLSSFKPISVKEALIPGTLSNSVSVKGWVKSIRKQKHITFININDGSSPSDLQVVVDTQLVSPDINYGSSIEAQGDIMQSTHPKQPVELQTSHVTLLGECNTEDFPFKVRTRHSLDFIRQFPHLRSKTKQFSALLRMRNTATMAIHEYFQGHGFINAHTPIITASDCEGAGELFQVLPSRDLHGGQGSEMKFFSNEAYLTVSGQLHAEAITCGMSKVYTFGPTFRAEKSHTSRHLAEFYMLEAETILNDSKNGVEELLQLVENLCKSILQSLAEKSSDDLSLFHCEDSVKETFDHSMSSQVYERIQYSQAIDILQKHLKENAPKFGDDLSDEHERYLVGVCGSRPLFITDYPATPLKPFYVKSNTTDTVQAFDLLMPGIGEVVGGSVREDDYAVLKEKLHRLNTAPDAYQWYLDLRKYGSIPHGGFGLGFDRLLQSALGVKNIRDIVPFPRFLGHCTM